MKNIKYTFYIIKELITKVTIYSLLYITIVTVSSLLVPAQIIYTQKLIDAIINNSDNVFAYTILLLITIVGGTVLHTLNTFIKPRLEHRFYIKFMGKVYMKMSNIDYIEFEKSENQDLFNNLTASPSTKVIYSFYELLNVVFYLVSLFGIVFSFFYMSPIIGIIALIVSLPMYLSECKGVNDEINYRWNMTKEIRKRAYIQSLFVDKEALQEIKVYNEKDYLFMKSDELTNTINNDLLKVVRKSILFTSFSSFIMIVFLLVIFITITYFITNGQIVVASYIAILTALTKFFNSSKSSTYAIASYLRQCKNVQLQEDFFSLPEQDTMNNSNEIREDYLDIEFKNVSFRYPNTNKDVLSNINLKIKTNERIALVGENGCGKSTLVKLLCGLYKPDSGVILINSVPTTEIGFNEMKKLISVIFQDYQHFQLSIRENVALAKIDEMHNDEKINEQLEIMKLDYLTNNDNNLETKLGKIYDDGINISHGEWQKLSLSRMMFNTNKLAILDEPTSALDPIMESKMYEYMYQSFEDIGLILVSHRLASVKLVNRILVIDNGSIVEDGSHSELMKNEGLYYKMYKSQSKWYISDGDNNEK